MKFQLVVWVVVVLLILGAAFFFVHHRLRFVYAPLPEKQVVFDTRLVTAQPSVQTIEKPAPTEQPPQVQAAPVNAGTSSVLSEAYPLVVAGKLDDALALINPAIQENPGDTSLLNARAFIYSQQGRLDDARQDLKKSLELGDKTSLVKFDLAEMDFRQKLYDAARVGFASLENDPERGDLSTYKAYLCDLLAGHEDDASRELGAFNAVGSKASYYFANVAWDLYHHKPEEARHWLDSATSIYTQKKIELFSASLTDLGYLPIPPPAPTP